MKELIERNYQSIRKRGLITDDTKIIDFQSKLVEEFMELDEAIIKTENDVMTDENVCFELADVILTALNFARHYEIDIESYLLKKIEINEKR
jgi:NTP pyrophosphatase (non-canonical NTP hydrolase)